MTDAAPRNVECAEILVDECGTISQVEAGEAGAHLVQSMAAGMRAVHCIHPEDRDLFQLMAARALRAGGRKGKVEIRWSRLRNRWSSVHTTFVAAPERRVRLLLRYDDVAKLRRRTEQMLRVVEASAQGIVVRTRDEILYMNEAFAKLLGYDSIGEVDVDYTDPNRSIHPDDIPMVLERVEARARGEETVSNYELRFIRRDNSIVWVEARAALVNWEGRPASVAWISDISRRKSIELELVRSKEEAEYANRSKTQFLANMSHELRTPLNAILGFSEAMERQIFGPVPQKYLGYAGDIHRSGLHLLDLVNDVLDLSKLEAGKLELQETELDVARLASECLALMRARADECGIRLVCELPELPLLRADSRAVKQILLNFLSNAVKFTHEGGTVRVGAASDRRSGVTVSVSDTGIGMTPAEIDIALTPFGQVDSKLARKHKGTGLGLPICRSLLMLHGGEMQVTSEPNKGTTLTARFPASRIVRWELAQAT